MYAICMLFYCFMVEFYGFVQPNTSIKAYHGNTVLLDCRVNTTFPVQSVIWTKESQTINKSRMIDLPNGMLIIFELNDSDVGNYNCEVGFFNSHMHVKRQSLMVEMIPYTGM